MDDVLQPLLFLRVLDGPQKGTRAPVRDGLTIGRKEGDLILKDSKMSVRHARVEWRETEWVLVDLDSSNKIKVEGERYGEVVLYAGLELMLGSTALEVLERPRADLVKERDFEFTGSIEVQADTLTWREILLATLGRVGSSLPEADLEIPIRPFPATVRLEFISGVQHGTIWHLGYGPRVAGLESFDLPLYDDAATTSSFHIDTAEGKVLFRSGVEGIVRLNGQVASAKPVELRSGDRIEFGKTRIRVSMA